MRKLLPLLSLCFLAFSFSAHSQNACARISCDCANLPLDSWKSICVEKEKQIVDSCSAKNNFTGQGFCSIHGPAANRIPLSIDLNSASTVAENGILRLNYKIAVLFWSLHKDLDMLQRNVNQDSSERAMHYVKLLDNNTDTIFNLQKQVSKSYMAANNEAEAQKSWRDYSTDTLKVGNMLYDYGKAMLNAAEAQTTPQQKHDTHALAFQLIKISGRIHEQAGYAYAKGVRHALAATTWKHAADISETLLKADNNRANDTFYRQQAAMRLNKASYYWLMGQGESETAISGAEELLQDGKVFTDAVEL